MGEGRIKTALELAMEKVAGMPKLDSEEINKQKQDGIRAEGVALGQKILNNTSRKIDLKKDLAKFQETERDYVRQALIETLKKGISFNDKEKNSSIIDALSQIDTDFDLESVTSKMNSIIEEFQVTLNMSYAKLEKEEIKVLKEGGISGSAVHPNLFINEEWKAISQQLKTEFSQRFEDI